MIVAPVSVNISKSKKVHLGLNWYRNAYFHELNKSKIIYKEIIKDQLIGLAFKPPVGIIYTYFPPDNRKRDLGNALAVQSKYFEDALVEFGYLTDDNYLYINQVIYRTGEVDKANPRVEITFTEGSVL